MDYFVHRDPDSLSSTAYIEIGPGRYAGKHWQRGFMFISEGAFGMAESIISRHFPQWDRFGINEIPRQVGFSIADAWEQAADGLAQSNASESAAMLRELAAGFRAFYQENDWVCILGM